jgi:hypothetical protein
MRRPNESRVSLLREEHILRRAARTLAVISVSVVTVCTLVACTADVDTAANTTGGLGPAGPDITTPATPMEEPEFTEIEAISEYGETPDPPPLSDTGTELEALSTAGPSRHAAESFAIAFAQLMSDTRVERPQAEVVAHALSRDAPDGLGEYLVEEYASQRALGSERRYEPGAGYWLRSAVTGPDDSPRTVSVEVVGVLVSQPFDVRCANRSRVDLVREDEVWKVAGYSWAIAGPNSAQNEKVNLRAHLTGSGWRQIVA